jgi:hypothetical protein
MSDEADDELPSLQLVARALMEVRVVLIVRGLIPVQEGEDATDQIERLGPCERWANKADASVLVEGIRGLLTLSFKSTEILG